MIKLYVVYSIKCILYFFDFSFSTSSIEKKILGRNIMNMNKNVPLNSPENLHNLMQ